MARAATSLMLLSSDRGARLSVRGRLFHKLGSSDGGARLLQGRVSRCGHRGGHGQVHEPNFAPASHLQSLQEGPSAVKHHASTLSGSDCSAQYHLVGHLRSCQQSPDGSAHRWSGIVPGSHGRSCDQMNRRQWLGLIGHLPEFLSF